MHKSVQKEQNLNIGENTALAEIREEQVGEQAKVVKSNGENLISVNEGTRNYLDTV